MDYSSLIGRAALWWDGLLYLMSVIHSPPRSGGDVVKSFGVNNGGSAKQSSSIQAAALTRDTLSPGSASLDDSIHDEGRFSRRSSLSSLQSAVGSCGASAGIIMNASRVYALRRSLSEHANTVSKLLLTGKDKSERRLQIESAFNMCKEAFFELSTVYLCLLNEKKRNDSLSLDAVKDMISSALTQVKTELTQSCSSCECRTSTRTYASVTGSSGTSTGIAYGPPASVSKSTNIMVIPKKDTLNKFVSSKDIKDTFQKIIKPSDFNLKVNRIVPTRNKGVRIEAHSVDMSKIKDSKELDRAGLKVEQMTKIKPRLIVHDVPVGMSKEDIKAELIALNLDKQKDCDLNVIYIFPPKKNRNFASCIIEVSPDIRTKLLQGSHVYVNYSACRLSDYVRVLQCYRCLAFGHLSRNCTAPPLCGHCAEDHEMRSCTKRNEATLCGNCKRWQHELHHHSALDGKTCPILKKRLQEKIKNTNYG